ncbi:MAG: hypothetical protein IJZ07_07715 [Clostridia bacterium]|nr:hypothetical protein [Clostridia bacterium]
MTDKIQKHLKRLWLAATALFAAGALATVIYYIVFPSEEFFHADCSDTLLWAQASYDSGTLFNPDFGYAAMLPFGGTMLMIPFIGIFGVSMTTHHIGMVLFTLLFFASAWLLCRSLKFSLPLSFSAVGILSLTLCASAKLREIFYEHVIYYSIGVAIIFVLLSLLIRFKASFSESGSPKKILAVVFFTVIFSALSALDGMQIIATGIFPVLFAAVAEIFLEKDRKLLDKENRASIYFCLICGISTVIGMWLLAVLSNGVTAGYAGAFSQYANMNEWLSNLGKFPEHWFALFGVDAAYGMGIFSVDSVLNIIRIAAAAIIAIVPVIALIFYKKFDYASKCLILSHFGVSAVIMFGYVFGILSAANWRLSPMICTGLMVCFAAFRAAKPYVISVRFSVLAVCVLLLMNVISVKTVAQMDKNGIENNEKYQLARILEENGLEYGFATFWNSQAITVLSDSRVRVANTDINENGITPCGYQANTKWFAMQEGIDEYFVLASDYELSILEQTEDWEMFSSLVKDAIRIEGYTIFIFDSVQFLV